jgi:hypothetical protein
MRQRWCLSWLASHLNGSQTVAQRRKASKYVSYSHEVWFAGSTLVLYYSKIYIYICNVYSVGPSCQLCGPGTFDHDANATSPCENCPSDTYQDQLGVVECTPCPLGRVAPMQSSYIDDCRCSGDTVSAFVNPDRSISPRASRPLSRVRTGVAQQDAPSTVTPTASTTGEVARGARIPTARRRGGRSSLGPQLLSKQSTSRIALTLAKIVSSGPKSSSPRPTTTRRGRSVAHSTTRPATRSAPFAVWWSGSS